MKKTILMLAIAALGFSTAAQATLIVRGTDSLGYQLIYDDDINITWYDRSMGAGTYWTASGWAAGLAVDFNGVIYSDWRLPEMWTWGETQAERTGEQRHVYANELGKPVGGLHNNNFSPFQHGGLGNWVQDFDRPNNNAAWLESFRPDIGNYDTAMDDWYLYAVAVRSGDVAAHTNPVPEPSTWLLLGSGLAGLAAFRKRFARK